jgi:hypothetical protein
VPLGDGPYQLLEPWQEFEQDRVVAFQPIVVVRFFTPFWCVAGLAVVVLYPVPWQVAQEANDVCRE